MSPPSDPIAAMPTRTRSTATIGVAGLGLAVLVAVLTDVLLGRFRKRRTLRRQRRSDEQSRATDPESNETSAPDLEASDSTEATPEPARSDAAESR